MKISSIILIAALLLMGTAAVAGAQTLTSDRPDYGPGEMAILTGSGFAPGEAVVLQVQHASVPLDSLANHGPWTEVADESGGFVAIGNVCGDAVGATLMAVADGQTSGLHAEATFTDAGPGEPTSDTPRDELYVTNGTVRGVIESGGIVYIGGTFSYVGPYTGCGVPIDATSGAPVAGFPKANGTVMAVAPDGSGGWYIGGNFTSVGGVARSRIAHIDAAYNVSAWDANANSSVTALAVSGSTVYAGGFFTSIGGATRNRIAALDATTGLTTAWNPNASADVAALAVAGGTVYAAGRFTLIGGVGRSGIAALDATTGLATTWNPNANGDVFALAVSGNTVYAGGAFTSIGGAARTRIAALDAITGNATAWNPYANSVVYALAVAGGSVYAGGAFGSIGGAARTRIAALDATTGVASAWNPNANGPVVVALAVVGSTVYAGGDFLSIGGAVRTGIVALDATTGLATAWSPNPIGGVAALAVSGNTVYAGGSFSGTGGVARSRIAALDATTGLATAWNPNANSTVSALAVSGSTVYAGGSFTSIGGAARNRIAALDATTGLTTAWNPNASSTVSALAVSGNTVYAGGSFTSIGGAARTCVAALDATTGLATAWNPNANNPVYALAVSGSTVYAGGLFGSIGGQWRSRIAALDAATGLATAWNPNANSTVSALAVNGNTVYAGGYFMSIGGAARTCVAALNATTGLATAWNPTASSEVVALAVSGSTVYAGGAFISIGGATRYRIAALDATTGLATAWNPRSDGNVSALAVSGSTLYVGGSFTSIGGEARRGFAGFTLVPDLPPLTIEAPADAGYACTAQVPAATPERATVTGGQGTPTVTVSEASNEGAGSAANPLILTRTWTATDEGGKTASDTQTATVVDAAAPALTVPAAVSVAAGPGVEPCGEVRMAVDFGAATATDNCGEPTVAVSGMPAGGFPVGTTTLTWTATDAVGNTANATQTVTVTCPVGRIAGAASETCDGATNASEGAVVRLLHEGNSFREVATAASGGFAFDEVRLGTYTVLIVPPEGFGVPIDTRTATLAGDLLEVEPFPFTCLLGDIAGRVEGACNGATTGLQGVTVDLYRDGGQGLDVLVGTVGTDASGTFRFDNLALGEYSLSLVKPLGYSASSTATAVSLTVPDGLVQTPPFGLACQPIVNQVRGMGYWKHQVNVYLTGKGSAQETLDQLLGYIDLMVEHFNQNLINPVIVYVPGSTNTNDRLLQLQQLLTVNKGGTALDRAKQHLLPLLLNVVSAKISQTEVISDNGANVSQAITYCHDLIVDGIAGNDETAKTIAEKINEGQRVPAGMVPVTTRQITYNPKPAVVETYALRLERISPNPAQGAFTVAFSLSGNGAAWLEVVDVAGRQVLRREVGWLGAGRHSLGSGELGSLALGVYFVRLCEAGSTVIGRVAVVR